MYFALTDEQRALQDAVRSFLRDRVGTEQVRAGYDDPAGDGVPAELWKAAGEQGWLAVLAPEEHGGLALGLLDAAVIARCFGAATAPGPWQATLLAAEAVRLAGDAEQQARWLPDLVSGATPATVALLRPGWSPTPAGAPATVADGRLSGRLELVEYANVARLLVVAAQGPQGAELFVVDPSASGVTVRPHEEVLDRTTRLATVELDGAPGERLAGSGPAVVQELLDRAAVLTANDLAGIARTALARTVDYDKNRVQFGRPVGSFQAIKHDLADLHVAVTMAEHAGLHAAHLLDAGDAGDPGRSLAVSVAKAKASDTARDATSAMIQYHGGIGYTWEHDAHFFFKRAKRLEYAYGDATQHRELLARAVLDAPRGKV